MNLDNMRELRDFVGSEDNPVGFDMRLWFQHNDDQPFHPDDICRIVDEHACGTAACLAGHAAILAWKAADHDSYPTTEIKAVARLWLEITHDQAHDLFYGWWSNIPTKDDLSVLTKEQAVMELTRLIAKEEIRSRHEFG